MVNKFNTKLCDKKMTFDECELTILRHAVDETTMIKGKESVNNEDVQKMIIILENFLIKNKFICYGGTAINNILPKIDQFYNREVEIPDYDFFSKNALEAAKELADIYYNEGFKDVEAKSGVHKGTYKVYVNFIPIADITYMNPEIYDNLQKDSIKIMGIHYCNPNYLRMSMYLELSRPAGDVSRWEKVLKRLTLLNKHYPLKPNIDCKKILTKNDEKITEDIFTIIKDSFVEQGVIFFGGYAVYLYSRYIPEHIQQINKIPQFDVLHEHPEQCSLIIKEKLNDYGVKHIEIVEHASMDDIIPKHYEIKVNKKSYAFIYEPIACHNYNSITIQGKNINVATIDTMLSFYLAFIYTDNKHYNKDRILCLAKYLFEIEQYNRLEQNGILKRFSTKCYGVQKGLNSIHGEKALMFKKLANKKGTKEYESWFLKYIPEQLNKQDLKKKKKHIQKYMKENEQEFKEKIDSEIEEKDESEKDEKTSSESNNKFKMFKKYKKNEENKTKKKKSAFEKLFTVKNRKGFFGL